MDFSIFFAGTAGPIPTARRGLPAVLVRRGADRILFDCGEGTQRQLVATVGLADLTDVFLTHFHADHWLGLPGMLKTFDLRGRERPLAIHGPPGLRNMLELAFRLVGRIHFELELVELTAGDVIARGGYRIAPVDVDHRGPAFGYVLFEDQRPGVFDRDAAISLGLEPGPEFGRVQRGETIRGVSPEQVLGAPRQGRKLVLSGDTMPCESLRIAAHGADLLIHEATFAEEERERARETGHSTAAQAAAVARDAEVAMLALTHVSTRHPLGLLRDEARAVFAQTVLPRDFDTIELPLHERGTPTLVRWEERAPAGATEGATGGATEGATGGATEDGADGLAEGAADRAASVAGRRGAGDRAGALNARIPQTLHTARMSCERLAPAHERDITRLMLDPLIAATLWPWPEPPSKADVHESFAGHLEHWKSHGFGLWCLRDSESGEIVGRGGLQYTDATGGQAVEAAWAVRPDLWGRGLATELADATVRVAFDDMHLDELIALTLTHNVACRRVLEKSGFAYERELVHVGLPHALYLRRPSP